MEYATLTNQNQITVPKVVRDSLGLKPGDKMEFYQTETSIIITKSETIETFEGFLAGKRIRKDIKPQDVWLERAERWYGKNNN